MAITFVDRTFGGVVKPAVVLRGTAGTEEILLQENLQEVDISFLKLADKSVGASLYIKLQATTLPNGRNALTFFAPRIKKTVDEIAAASRRVVAKDPVTAILDLQTAISELEESA